MLKRFVLAIVAVYVLATCPADASFHDWRIDQIFSDSTGKVQYIQLGDVTDAGENFLIGQAISSGNSSFTFPADLPNLDTANRSVLIATKSYAKQTGSVTPDYTIADSFFHVSGDTIDYAGVDSFTFSGAQLPKDGALALNKDFSTSANHQKNFVDEEGGIKAAGGGPSAIPLPAAVWPGLMVLGGWITHQTRRRA